MNCMKCGRETKENQIFCEECLSEMAEYPVKPGTVVQIPVQPPVKTVHHRRTVIPFEDQVRQLKNSNRCLVLLSILMTAIALVCVLLMCDVLERDSAAKLLGQNYNVAVSTETPSETVAPSPLH